jgi:hypothetical protein
MPRALHSRTGATGSLRPRLTTKSKRRSTHDFAEHRRCADERERRIKATNMKPHLNPGKRISPQLQHSITMLSSAQAAFGNREASPLVGTGEGLGLGVESGSFRKFKKGDRVFHRPTGETWYLIADERDGWVTPGGWPPSQGRAEDCKLVDSRRQEEDGSVRQPSPNNRDVPTSGTEK